MIDDIYVVVAENNSEMKMPSGKSFKDDGGPLVFEQYTRTAGIESIKARAAMLEQQYGPCRIARLVFVDDERGE